MPSSPRNQKRSGAPKAKGAVRAKSGCYTCRIRRKKCDEQANGEGNCQTCVRLKLQCLGFGAKRPEWLRENRNVQELREKIKGFLASQGMIKGHSGSASRITEQEHSTLRLADDGSSSSGSSPTTPTLTIDEIRPSHTTSSVRDLPWHPYNTALPSQGQELSPDDSPPFVSSVEEGLTTEVMLGSYSNSLPPITSPSSHSLVSSSSWAPQTTLAPSHTNAAIIRSFTPYNYDFSEEEDCFQPVPVPVNTFFSPFDLASHSSVQYYKCHVLDLQYLLANQDVFARVMEETIRESDVAYKAVCLLSSVHQYRVGHMGDPNEIGRRYRSLQLMFAKDHYDRADAVAALHTISSLLFVGGRGAWPFWLNVAYFFIDSILRDPRSPGVVAILRTCREDLRYIIKTAMWFDVLASICLFRTPHFLQEYRELFEPPDAHIDTLLPQAQPELSMQLVMGCENRVVWALAEVTDLLAWKENEQRLGRLSVPVLVERGLQIEKHIQCRSGPPLPPRHEDLDYHRYVTSDVFRASTRVYLHSVLSGDHPSCPEIMEGIEDTLRCLDRVTGMGGGVDTSDSGGTTRSVVRSVVFSIFLCGCLTDDPGHRSKFQGHLEAQESETVGNISEIKGLMLEVWHDRARRGPEEPVQWRAYLKSSGILLV